MLSTPGGTVRCEKNPQLLIEYILTWTPGQRASIESTPCQCQCDCVLALGLRHGWVQWRTMPFSRINTTT